MRHVPKWITGATMAITAGAAAGALAAAVPTLAQESGSHHQAPTLTATSGNPNLAEVTMETPTPVNTPPAIIGPSGTTGPAPS